MLIMFTAGVNELVVFIETVGKAPRQGLISRRRPGLHGSNHSTSVMAFGAKGSENQGRQSRVQRCGEPPRPPRPAAPGGDGGRGRPAAGRAPRGARGGERFHPPAAGERMRSRQPFSPALQNTSDAGPHAGGCEGGAAATRRPLSPPPTPAPRPAGPGSPPPPRRTPPSRTPTRGAPSPGSASLRSAPLGGGRLQHKQLPPRSRLASPRPGPGPRPRPGSALRHSPPHGFPLSRGCCCDGPVPSWVLPKECGQGLPHPRQPAGQSLMPGPAIPGVQPAD